MFALVHTCETLILLCEYLLQKFQFHYVLLAKFQSDSFESRFNKEQQNRWYTTVCLPRVFERLKAMRLSSALRHWGVHHDNAPSHQTAATAYFLKASGIRLLEHSPHSPDLAP
ncbi:hypothetical protein ILUMI_27248 [Ignelater luminosus]|uniref:Transposase n=1 Tax=Ignelater luminosus TaxID=2038154 RepID=A0A8K0FYC7_IGNLU|nr:hypothetical protein ILUMI_27248 [Ignelater luminosus]